jgi:AcrR family transcriptional regulator
VANKNDLRFVKTERLIRSTYLALRRKARQPVKVRELCEAALINKSTFYAHYETMGECRYAHA